ncbi:MAG: hypothetical protein JWO48_3668 [Bryobacterales bacterium]|nr:hypothetical protein [Bryobacterales bacterium]
MSEKSRITSVTHVFIGDSAPSDTLKTVLSQPPAKPAASPRTTSSSPGGNGTGKAPNAGK